MFDQQIAISKLPEASHVEVKEDQVQIDNYAGLFSAWFNQNWLGFQLDRNGLNFWLFSTDQKVICLSRSFSILLTWLIMKAGKIYFFIIDFFEILEKIKNFLYLIIYSQKSYIYENNQFE